MAEFSKTADFVLFTDNKPGNYATMFGTRGPLTFRRDASSWDDNLPRYTWAFEDDGSLTSGPCRVAFATEDREVAAVWDGASFSVGGRAHVAREAGRPVSVEFSDTPPVVLPVVARVPAAPLRDPRPAPSPPSGSSRFVVASSLFTPRDGAPTQPKVSFVTCAYNRPDMLREAVESLRAQTDSDWEHLIYDNGSTDPRVAGVLAWAAEDPRVRVWRSDDNRDQPAVFWNFLLDRALGRYLTVLDDDNTKLPGFVEYLAGALDADPSIDAVTCGWIIRRPSGEESCHLNLETRDGRLDSGNTCDGGAMLYRREAVCRVGYFPEDLRTNEDWDWLRRLVRVGRVRNLAECYATYRCHEVQRMTRSASLGSDEDIARLRDRQVPDRLGVRLVHPPADRLTRSQEDVCEGIERALGLIPWVTAGDDLALVLAPFQLGGHEIWQQAQGCRVAVSMHMEDPYALEANLDRVRLLAQAVPETWVCTNDASAASAYVSVVGGRVVVCPTLGLDTGVFPGSPSDDTFDVLLCGYAYPSRQALVRELLPRLGGLRVHLQGDGWEGFARGAVTISATQGKAATYATHSRARAVVCLHRTHGDCADGPFEPVTVNRGHMEGAFGARVFLDGTRSRHAFDPGDVVWYDGVEDLAVKILEHLASPDVAAAARHADKCQRLYTYRERIVRVLNCVRSPRFFAEIP